MHLYPRLSTFLRARSSPSFPSSSLSLVTSGHSPEGRAVNGTSPVFPNGGQMLRRAVSLVFREPVHRKLLMKRAHDSVPVHLGHNGGRGNAVAAAVPFFQAPIGYRDRHRVNPVQEENLGRRS